MTAACDGCELLGGVMLRVVMVIYGWMKAGRSDKLVNVTVD